MNKVETSNSKSKFNEMQFIEDQQNNQAYQQEQQYEQNYDQQFEQIDKSHEKKTIQQNHLGSNKNYQSINQVEEKQNKYLRNQIPSKENNWNQKAIKQQKQNNQGKIVKNLQTKKQQSKENKYTQSQLDKSQQQSPIIIENQNPQQESIHLLKQKQENQAQIKQKNPKVSRLKTNEENNFQQHKEELYKNKKIPLIPQKSKEELSHQSYQNQKLIKELKQKVVQQRNQIKNIGNSVDKDIQKSIYKLNNKNNKLVNIKELFSQTSKLKNQNQSQKLQKLKEQLKNIRLQSKTLKNQIINIQTRLSDPITAQNNLKYQQNQLKFKNLSQQCSKNKKQKDFMNVQLKRMKEAFNLEEKQQYEKSMQKNQNLLNTLLSQIKEQRSKLYKLQKNDIVFMQKLKFYVQKDQKSSNIVGIQSQKAIQQIKANQQQIRYEIKDLVQQINSIFDERNKTQIQRVKLIKTLQAQVQQIQAKNMETLNQIRNIDSNLLQFYIHKVSKKNSSVSKQMPKTAQRLHQTIDSGSPLLRQKNLEQKFEINDKNMIVSSSNKFRSKIQNKKNKDKVNENTVQTQEFVEDGQEKLNLVKNDKMIQNQIKGSEKVQKQQKKIEIKWVQVKTIINFGDLKVDQKGAILSDQILGKVKIKELCLFVDKKNCYGVQCKYYNQEKPQIFGMKICQKNADEKCEKLSLILNTSFKQSENQQICSIKIGYSARNQIKLIQINTSKNNTLKWASQNQIVKTDTKTIGKYSSISIKAKLISSEDVQGTNKSLNQLLNQKSKLKLAGIGFTVYELKKGQ